MDVRQFAYLARQPSAQVNNRERFWGMPKRGLAFLLANVMFWQPLWAQADGIVVATPGTTLDHAGNGVQVINIATPNGSGLSHNQFVDYNVGAQGVILNNGSTQTSATQLGGIIIGNPHLKNSGSAQTILNEVVGGSPSQLRGYTEVAGQSARVIVANPYGITCNGCGFINTPRATLTTGKPVIDGSGRLERFQVDQGSVAIEGAGLNAGNVDRFEIITRSAKINAEIQANNLTIVAGRNDVNAQTLNASARADDGSLKPQLAIDSSALGGMYAGAIKLVGTEAGVGVKVAGNLAASGGDIQIDANGHLSLAQTSAAGAVNVKAVSLDAQSAVYAGTRVDMQTQTDLNSALSIAARDSVTLNAGRTLTNSGVIEAGVNADNSRNAKGDASLSAQKINNTGKSVVASRDLTVTVLQALNNQGGTLSGQRQVTVNAATLDNQNQGRVLSADRLSLTADKVLNSQGGLIKGQGQVEATLGHLSNNAGEVSSQGNATLILGSLDNSSGTLMAQMGLDLSASAAINNQGGLVSGWQGLTLTGTRLDNSNGGTLSSRSGDVDIRLSDAMLNNAAGAVVSQKALTITAASLDNTAKGNISSTTDQTITVSGLLDNSAEGLLSSGVAMTLNAMALNNVGGTVNASGDLAFNGTELNNSQGTFTGQQAITLDLLGALINTQGRMSSSGPLLIQRSTQVNNQGGELSSQSWLSLFTGELNNSGRGTVAAGDKLLITAGGNVDNTNDGLIASRNGELELDAGSLANAKGQLQAKQTLHVEVTVDVGNQDGQIVAKQGKLSVKAANLDNQRGRLAALNDGVRVETAVNGTFDNRNGSAYAKTLLEIDAKDLDNSDGQISASQIGLNLQGALNNRNGLIESLSTLATTAASLDNQNGQLRALGIADKTLFSIGGTFDNRAGRLETANTDLSIEATGFKNQGGSLLHAGNGVFGLSMANLNDVGGRLVTQGDLTLDTDTWTNSTSIQAERLTVNVKHLTQTSTGQLLAATHLEGVGDDWRNDGLIGSDGTLTLDLTGSYAGEGRLSSLGDLKLHAGTSELQVNGSIAGGRDTQIDIDALLVNAGRITSSNNLTLKAGDINNGGTLGSGKDLLIDTASLLNDHGLISSGGNAQLLASSFTNRYAQVYSLGSILIAKDATQAQADLLDNRSGAIESLGQMTIAASTINNEMDVLEYTPNEKAATSIVRLPCELIPGAGCDARGGGRINGLWEIHETDRLKVTKSSAASSLSSGADLLINTQTLTNTSSTVAAAGNLQINANTINNRGLQTQEINTVRRYWSFVNETGNAAALADTFNARNNPNPSASFASDLSAFLGWMGVLLAQNSTVTDGDQSFAAVIQSGGSANLNAGQTLNNSVVRSFYAYIGAGQTQADTSAGSGYSTPVFINAQLPPEVAQQQVNPVALPGFTLPTNQNGLFRLSSQGSSTTNAPSPLAIAGLPDKSAQSKPHKYLIETNPALTDLKQFMSSDYLLSNLGYDPDTSAKRLGDGFYEQRMIQQAVTARTGQRFIDGQDSDEKLFKYLMDNAVQSKQQLDLSVGVSLTAEQIAALTHDIVWLESHEVNGEQVLVPVLYMAHADNRLAPTGALIAGNDVSLIAGQNLNNVGTLRASNNLSAVAGENIVNSGLVEAEKRLDLLAGNNLVNRAGGIIAGRDVSLTATQGDVINERTVTTHQSSGGGYTHQEQRDFADSAARIEAGNDLTVKAGQDINIIGGALQSGQDMSLSAARDVNVSSVQVSSSVAQSEKNTSASTTQLGSNLDVGRDLSVQAGRDIALIASEIGVKRDVAMNAVGDLTLASAANEQHAYGAGKKFVIQEDHVQQVSTVLAAGGNVALKAGEDMTLIASRVSAGKEAYLYAGGDLDLGAAQNSDYSYFSKTKTSSSGLSSTQKTRMDSSRSTTQQGSSVSADAVVMRAGQDIGVVASDVVSTQSTSLVAGRNVVIDGATETFEDSHSTSEKKSGLLSSGGIGVTIGSTSTKNTSTSITETTRASTVGSVLGNVSIEAGKDLTIKGSDVVAGNNIRLVGQNVSILASENSERSEQTSKSKSSGLTLALSGTVGSAVDSAYQTAKQARSEDDSRLAALQGVKAGLTGVQAWQAAQQSGGMTADNAGQFIGISLSLGTQKSDSRQTQERSVSQGSSLTSGNNLTIVAAGNGDPGADGDIRIQGSKLQTGNEMLLAAERDIHLEAAANTQKLDGKNSSSGDAIGASIGVGSDRAGLTIFANANKGAGSQKGNGTVWTETTLDAGKQVSLISGRDTALKGAQVSADKIAANVGRDLLLQSLQDSDDYKSKQTDVSGGIGFTFGSMTVSGSLSISKSKIDSEYESVQEQTGFFSGKGGYQIDVGNHTQLDGSVIASTADESKNRLSTGTLGWSDLKNSAEYKSSLQSASVSSSNSGAGGFTSNMPSGTLIAFNHGDSAKGTTSSAVSNGTLVIRDTANQHQDVATLSHDVEHANGSISPIFDKEKEQNRLRQVQLIGDIGTQAMDIVRTQGELNAKKAAREELALKDNANPSEEQLRETKAYKDVMGKYGTGGDYQRAAQAVTAALQGLAGGDIGSALAGASAPYVANLIKHATEGNNAARIMAQAVLGAVVAKVQGNSALAGGAGAAVGELIAAQLYPDRDHADLTEAEKQTVAALSSLAAGFVGAAVGGGLSGAVTGAQAGRNATENNDLGSRLYAEREYANYAAQSCGGLSAEVCRSNYGKKVLDESHIGVVGVGIGAVAGGILFGPELLAACGVNLAACTELGITAAELPFGAATAGGAALGMGGFGSIAAKEVAAFADAAAHGAGGAKGNQLINGKWVDGEGLPLPVPSSVGASGRVPNVLQTGGNTLNKSTANGLNEYFGESLTPREWGRALEALKADAGKLPNNFHGRILDNGDYVGKTGEVIGNIRDYLP